LDRALTYTVRVRALVQTLADKVATANNVPLSPVPHCAPATLMDQLTVMVYDATSTTPTKTLTEALATLRHNLR
jgi:hypothetical protein